MGWLSTGPRCSWSTTLSYHHQTTDSGAGNYYDPFVGDLQVVRFHNEWREEDFDMASLVVEGDMQFAQVVAAVSYFERSIKALDDITTGTEPSFALEWTWLALSTPLLCLLGWVLFRRRPGRARQSA